MMVTLRPRAGDAEGGCGNAFTQRGYDPHHQNIVRCHAQNLEALKRRWNSRTGKQYTEHDLCHKTFIILPTWRGTIEIGVRK